MHIQAGSYHNLSVTLTLTLTQRFHRRTPENVGILLGTGFAGCFHGLRCYILFTSAVVFCDEAGQGCCRVGGELKDEAAV